MLTLWYIIIGFFAAFLFYLVLQKIVPLLINYFDRANTNDRYQLPPEYERPRYYAVNCDGTVNTARKWPGWDGWYFLTLFGSKDSARLIRGSIMTGMYGIEDIDNYQKLMLNLSTDSVVECLFMLPQPEITLLSHEYLPKYPYLEIQTDRLDVTVTNRGKITGKWPEYRFELSNPQDGITLSLRYRAQDIIWWADLTEVFTYFTSFGQMEGELKKNGELLQNINSIGSFDHGFAKKCFNYDPMFLPVRMWKRLFSFNVVHYHYDLLFTEEGLHGGLMRTNGFGIKVRNFGGLYLPGGEYVRIKRIKSIRYEKPRLMEIDCMARPVTFYEQWHIKAVTEKGILSYTARQVHPPAHIAKHMLYYSFLFEGSLGDQRFNGKGYGEYVRM